MPYVKKDLRDKIISDSRLECKEFSTGALNFTLSANINFYLMAHGLSYQTINDVIGALEGAKMEFYRRVAVPYEQKKLKENGDVYDSKFTK